MDFINDHALEARKHARRVFVRGEQRQAFGRGQQDMRRVRALAFLLRGRGVACAILDPDIESDFFDRCTQVSLDIRGQRLERAHIERMQTIARGGGQFCKGWQKPGKRFAPARWRDQQQGFITGALQHLGLVGVDGPSLPLKPVIDRLWQFHNAHLRRTKLLEKFCQNSSKNFASGA